MSIEAMKLALDALEDTHYRIIRAGLLDQDLLNRNFTVATALRERLAQPEQEPVAIDWERIAKVQNAKLMAMCDEAGGFEKLCEVMDKYEATHQPQRTEQEPVAWKWRVKDFCDWPNWSVSLKRPADSGHAQYPRTEGYEDIPLYTTPPQRPWVGLTDEEKGFCAAPTYVETVARIEAKLKEKNA